jgi:hypothetical protein
VHTFQFTDEVKHGIENWGAWSAVSWDPDARSWGVGRQHSSRIWMAALSWVRTSALRNSSFSMSPNKKTIQYFYFNFTVNISIVQIASV